MWNRVRRDIDCLPVRNVHGIWQQCDNRSIPVSDDLSVRSRQI